MGRREKLVDRFLRLPKDFTFDEVVTLLGYFNYHIDNKGSTLSICIGLILEL